MRLPPQNAQPPCSASPFTMLAHQARYLRRCTPCLPLLLMLFLALLAGCVSTPKPQAELAPHIVEAEAYHDAMHAAAQTLLDYQFHIARQDARFGVVESHPRHVPTLAEVWDPTWIDARTASRATLQDLFNRASIRLVPVESPPGEPAQYLVTVNVDIERVYRNLLMMDGVVVEGQMLRALRSTPAEWERQGVPAVDHAIVGQNAQLAARLAQNMLKRMQEPRATSASETDQQRQAGAPADAATPDPPD